MKSFELQGTARTIAERSSEQSRALKNTRKEGNIPCVLYGNGNEPIHFLVKKEAVQNLIYTPHIYVVNLTIDGKLTNAILKEIQFHPVKDNVLHIDFMAINEEKPIVMQVPVELKGLAAGVKAGGKLFLQMRKLKVKALYNVIPEKIIVDVTSLTMGKAIKVGNLNYEGMELLNPKDAMVCSVKTTRAGKGMDLPEEAAPAAEGETPAAE